MQVYVLLDLGQPAQISEFHNILAERPLLIAGSSRRVTQAWAVAIFCATDQ